MQVFKVSDKTFKNNLANKVLDDLFDYVDKEFREKVLNNLNNDIFFTVQTEYGFSGFISLLDEGDILSINFMGIFKNFARQKSGQTLIKAAIDFAKANKKKAIIVTIKDDSSQDINYLKTRRFFTKMGFSKLAKIDSIGYFNPSLVMGYIV